MNSNRSGDALIHQVALQFGLHHVTSVESFSEGLIHHTYKVTSDKNQVLVIQSINTHVFPQPEIIISNYLTLFAHLQRNHVKIPAPIACSNGDWFWKSTDGMIWRAQEFIKNSYAEKSVSTEKAFQAARCFARFASALATLDQFAIDEPIQHFHDLDFRNQQLREAIAHASEERLYQAEELIQKIYKRNSLFTFYETVVTDHAFKKRIMHHDCKLTNILFSHETHTAICPVDLDTTMPGYFFSDFGDMVRSMTASADENSTAWESLTIKNDIYVSVYEGYRAGIEKEFSSKENQYLHHAGPLMLFMQAIRFLTDFLSNDHYYKISYPDQNLNRAKNQLLLLEKLEVFLKQKYHHSF